ncbi:MAG: bacterial Ig-like domain-containing protein [Treponema sp.]|jgi:acetoacetate decarboxylase|nr:bacterial Ig-like domain-containing protein [Treponema sp.]
MKQTFEGKSALIAFLVTMLIGITISCSGSSDSVSASSPSLESIAVTSPPAKTEYARGEDLDLSGFVVTATYSDGTTSTHSLSNGNVSGYNANSEGTQTLTVEYGDRTATFQVTVGSAVLRYLNVTNRPDKTSYALGEPLDLSGLVVRGTYSDGTGKTETVSDSDVSGYDANTMGSQTLTVTINGKTTNFNIIMNSASLQSIAITSLPTKTVYSYGNSLDLSGLVVTGTYSDGTTQTETVSMSNISGYERYGEGQQTLTVTLWGYTATFTVTISPRKTMSFTVKLEDPINGLDGDIVLSKLGTPSSVSLEVSGTYASYAWYLNDNETPVSSAASYTLNAADCPLGRNYLSVEARTNGGAYHSKDITFTVE